MSTFRVGEKVPLNVYEGDRPAFQCHTPEDAQRYMRMLNAGEGAEGLRSALEEVVAEIDSSFRTEQRFSDEQIARFREALVAASQFSEAGKETA